MSKKILPLTRNQKNYEDVPDGLKWAVPLHEHLTSPSAQNDWKARKALSEQRVEAESKKRVEKEFQRDLKQIVD